MISVDSNHSAFTAPSSVPVPSSLEEALATMLRQRAGDVDALISILLRTSLDLQERMNAQLNAILEAEAFQTLEARWRSLQDVVWSKGSARSVKIKLLNVSWTELTHDLHYTSDLQRSALVQIIGKNEFETLGGEPFGLLVVDQALSVDVDTEFDQLYTAQLLGDLGAICVCPIVLGISDDFFGESDAAWYTDTNRIENILSSDDYQAWQTLREAPNSRFLALAMPRIQLRGRYEDLDIGSFRFHQWPSDSEGLWGNAAAAFATTVISEFNQRAWFGFLKLVAGEPGSGAVLATPNVPAPRGTVTTQRTRTRLTRQVAQFYSEQGFIPLAESTKSHALYFVGNRSVVDCNHNPAREVLTQIQSVLIACRLVHYTKVKIRHLIGQVLTTNECEGILNAWLEAYVSTSSMGSTAQQAKFPLRGARVKITQDPTDAARYHFNMLVQPRYQIDHVLGDIVLTTNFVAPEGAFQ